MVNREQMEGLEQRSRNQGTRYDFEYQPLIIQQMENRVKRRR